MNNHAGLAGHVKADTNLCTINDCTSKYYVNRNTAAIIMCNLGRSSKRDVLFFIYFLFYLFIFLRKDTCPPNHINVTNNWNEEKEV